MAEANKNKQIRSTYHGLPVTHEREGGKHIVDPESGKFYTTERQRHIAEVVDSIKLEEWDPKTLPKNFFVVFQGKRRTGKSTMCKWLLQFYKDSFSLVWCMTMTKSSGYWQQMVGSEFTFDGWYPNAISRLIDRNDSIVKKYGEESETTYKLASTLIILDDVISANIHDDPTLVRLAVEGRHHIISVVLLTQDPKAIGPKVRDNTDATIVFNMKTERNKESIWRDYMQDVPKDVGYALLNKHCVEHDSLVCVQTNLNSEMKKNFFVSTGDKTQLRDPNYCLGDRIQKQMVLAEREAKEKDRKMKEKGTQPKENDDTKSFTIDKILRGKK